MLIPTGESPFNEFSVFTQKIMSTAPPHNIRKPLSPIQVRGRDRNYKLRYKLFWGNLSIDFRIFEVSRSTFHYFSKSPFCETHEIRLWRNWDHVCVSVDSCCSSVSVVSSRVWSLCSCMSPGWSFFCTSNLQTAFQIFPFGYYTGIKNLVHLKHI